MAHYIEDRDIQEGRKMGWHKLTQINDDLSLKNNHLIGYELEEKPIIINNQDTGWRFLVSDDDDLPVGNPFKGAAGTASKDKTYDYMNNKEFLDSLEIIENSGLVLESIGTVKNRALIFATFAFPKNDGTYKIGDREFKAFFNIHDSRDQTFELRFLDSNICVVCYNTYNISFFSQGKQIDFTQRHSKNFKDRASQIMARIEQSLNNHEEFKKNFEYLLNISCDTRRAEKIFAGFLGNRETKEISTVGRNRVDILSALFNSGDGNNGDNLADVFSAVTDFYSHFAAGEGKNRKNFISSEFGMGSRMKQVFFSNLLVPEKLQEIERFGELVITF